MFIGIISGLFDRARTTLARGWGRPLRREGEVGQGMVEYALILMLVALVVIVILSVLGAQVNNVFSNIGNGLSQ